MFESKGLRGSYVRAYAGWVSPSTAAPVHARTLVDLVPDSLNVNVHCAHPQRRLRCSLFTRLSGSCGWIRTESWRAITGFLRVTASPESSGTAPCCVRMTSHWLLPGALCPLGLNTCTHVCHVKPEKTTLYRVLFCGLQVLSPLVRL